MKTRWFNPWILAAVMLLSSLPQKLHACAVCFGDPSSPLVQGAKYGVLFLAGVIYLLLFSMLGVVFVWYKRARALEEQESAEAEVS